MRKRTWARLLAAAMALYLLLPLFGCGAQDGTPQSAPQSATETERLVKLCKVWGYVKYTHSAFLLGQKDWDEELLALVPQVRERETQEEVNALLHDWFVSLGEIDYGRGNRKPSKVNKEDWVIEADTSWTKDAEYLGEDLTADLAQLPEELPSLRKEDKAPVFFDEGPGTPNFSNEQDRAGDYDDIAFRLLGLFRLWNGIEYYFPYLHLMDRSWESCLPDAIESMMAGTDQASYEEAIYALTGCLQDNHVMVVNSESKGSTAGKYFGSYMFPVPLEEAEGKLVVTEGVDGCPLAAGDVLAALNGETIDTIAEAAKKYFSNTRDEVFLKKARYMIASSETEDIEVTVLREEETLTLSVKGTKQPIYNQKTSLPPYEILEDGIGLINPKAIVDADTLHEAMGAVKDMKSLIIDLRQYPGGTDFMYLYYYLPSTYQECMIFSHPAQVTPGSYIKHPYMCGYDPSVLRISKSFYPWEKPVVVLMDKTTLSFSEMAVTIFSTDENVTVLGENSMGSDGNVVYLPLPGGISVSFTSLGCYEVDGTQTQRTGITPDIPVSRTIQGVKEGRDELMEAAVQYLTEHE